MALPDQIIGVESGNDPNATNPNSSAGGAGQFIDSTWLDMLQRHRPDLMEGRSRDDLLALKKDPGLSRDMVAAYAADNAGILSKAGLPVTPGTQYLAHFAGPQGAIGILQADPSTPAGAILGGGVVKANPFLAKMTAGDLAAWADRKMGGAPAAAAPSRAPGAQPQAPLSLAPPGAPGAGQQQPQQDAQEPRQSSAAPSQPSSVPDYDNLPKTPPMLLPQRPRLDLNQLAQLGSLYRRA